MEAFEARLGLRLTDRDLLRTALTHRSYAFEQGGLPTNERLEFLGDAVLGMIVTDLAYRAFPEMSEGDLAKLRAATVSTDSLAEVARELRLGEVVLLGKGEESSGGRGKSSILADAMEAILGAVYLDAGAAPTWELIETLFFPRMASYARGEGKRDYKTSLQELAAQDLGDLPEYRLTEHGPDHRKEFTATVFVGGKALGEGTGGSKKRAEQQAARQAFEALTRRPAEEDADGAS